MNEDFTAAASYPSSMEAHISRAFLEERGFPCFISDEALSHLAWHLTRAIGGVKLYVRQSDLDAVTIALQGN